MKSLEELNLEEIEEFEKSAKTRLEAYKETDEFSYLYGLMKDYIDGLKNATTIDDEGVEHNAVELNTLLSYWDDHCSGRIFYENVHEDLDEIARGITEALKTDDFFIGYFSDLLNLENADEFEQLSEKSHAMSRRLVKNPIDILFFDLVNDDFGTLSEGAKKFLREAISYRIYDTLSVVESSITSNVKKTLIPCLKYRSFNELKREELHYHLTTRHRDGFHKEIFVEYFINRNPGLFSKVEIKKILAHFKGENKQKTNSENIRAIVDETVPPLTALFSRKEMTKKKKPTRKHRKTPKPSMFLKKGAEPKQQESLNNDEKPSPKT